MAPPTAGGGDAATRLIREVETLRRARPDAAWQTMSDGFHDALRGAGPAARGELWRLRGHVLRSLRRLRPAIEAYRRAESWYGRAGDTRERGRCAIGLVDALMYAGRYREASAAAARGRHALGRSGDWAAQARLLNNEGNLHHRTDRPDRALACYTSARAALKRAGDARGQGLVEGNMANCYSLLGRLGEARKLYRRSRNASLRRGFAVDALNAEYNLAYLEFLDLHHERALEDLDRVREQARSAGVPGLTALSSLDRAEILLKLGDHRAALAEAETATQAFAGLSMVYERAKAETFGALAEFRLGRSGGARVRLERALGAFLAEGNAVWAGEVLVGLATLWWSQNLPAAAAPLLSAAARGFSRVGDREREGCARALLARVQIESGRPGPARASLVRAHSLARGPRSARLRHLVSVAAADLARRRGDIAGARTHLLRAARESERLAARILDEQWRASFWGEWGWPHQELAALELDQGRIEAAFEAMERGRGRALASPSRRSRRATLAPAVRSWAASGHARDRDRGARAWIPGTLPARPPREAAPLRRLLDGPLSPGILRARDLTRRLTDGTLLLDYFQHRGVLGAFALTRGGMRLGANLGNLAEVERLSHAALFELRRAAMERPREGAGEALGSALAELASLVLWPLLNARGLPRTLAVVPVSPLTRLPWAALPLPDGRRLGEVVRIVLVPGLRLALATPAPAKTQPHGLVVASPAEGLENVGPEADAVRGAMAGAVMMDGDRASAAGFLEQAPRARWIHFAGHGFFQAGGSGIRLHDRWVLAEELEGLRLSARWVSLSACQTARALVGPGEEWFGLARAFLLAGAGAVLAAQWDVDDAAAARFMTGVYGLMAAGAPLGEAVSATQREAARAGIHPVDWAGFVVLGGPEAAEARA